MRLNTVRSNAEISNMQVHLNLMVWGLLFSLFALCVDSAGVSVSIRKKG